MPHVQGGYLGWLLPGSTKHLGSPKAWRLSPKISRASRASRFSSGTAHGLDRVSTFLLRFPWKSLRPCQHGTPKNKRSPIHPLEGKAGAADYHPNPDRGYDEGAKRTTPLSHQQGLKKQVFVDDFCGVGQDHPMNPLDNQRKVSLHQIDKIFRPTDDQDKESRKEPISESKLDKQDAAWQDMKRCLGWDYGAKSKLLAVAPHHREKARTTLAEALSQKRVSLTKWQSLIGQLRSLTDGLPGSEGKFSLLQHDLTKQAQGGVRIDGPVRQQLHTFEDLLNEDNRPTQLEELVAGNLVHIGACDAAKPGMGGVVGRT
jgi:hypothetical protein